MKTLVISFNGKTPNEQEHEQLTREPFDKTPFSFVKRNKKIVESLLCFLVGIGGVLFSWFLFWSKIAFKYHPSLGGGFTAALFGFSLSLFYQGIQCFRSRPTKQDFKKPQHVLYQYGKCLLDLNYFHVDTIDTGRAYATLQCMLPKSQRVEYKTFEAYLTDFHLKMMTIIKNDAKALNLPEYGFKVSIIDTSITSNKIVSHDVEKLTMEVNLSVKFTQLTRSMWRDKLVPTQVSHIKLVFNMTLIQLGKYWFVYDPLPDYEVN
jgi:hypothetical protein